MFYTRPDEYIYFKTIYPGIGDIYMYNRFPMGTHNSHSASGSYGTDTMYYIIDSSPVFNVHPVDNSIYSYPTKHINHSCFDEGKVLIGSDGLPAALL